MKNFLTKQEIATILSKNLYWQEVKQRDNTEPLAFELQQIIRELGTKLLFIVAEYAEYFKEDK